MGQRFVRTLVVTLKSGFSIVRAVVTGGMSALVSIVKWGMLGMAAILAGGIFGSLKLASAAEEIENKYRVVFKGLNKEADQIVRNFRRRFGLATSDLRRWMAGFQDTFVPLGFARDKAMALSKTLTELSIDLASFHDDDPAIAMRRMTSALVGNHEAVRAYGIVLSESTLNAKLLEQGIKGGTREATAQQKVMARLGVILDGTKDAQGDMERSATSFANTMRRMGANFRQLFENIGKILLPISTGISNIIGAFAELGARVVNNQLPKFKGMLEGVKEMLDAIATAIRSIDLARWIKQGQKILGVVGNIIQSLLSAVWRAMSTFLERLGEHLGYTIASAIYEATPSWMPGKSKPKEISHDTTVREAVKDAFLGKYGTWEWGGFGPDGGPRRGKPGPDGFRFMDEMTQHKQALKDATTVKWKDMTWKERMRLIQANVQDKWSAAQQKIGQGRAAWNRMQTAHAKLMAGGDPLLSQLFKPLRNFLDPEQQTKRAETAKETRESGWGWRAGKWLHGALGQGLMAGRGAWGDAQFAAGGGVLGALAGRAGGPLGQMLGGLAGAGSGDRHRSSFMGLAGYGDAMQLALLNQNDPQKQMARDMKNLAGGVGGFFATMGNLLGQQTARLGEIINRATP